MTKPERRKSQLSGLSPVAPAPAATQPEPIAQPPQAARPPRSVPAPTETGESAAAKKKLSYYGTAADDGRIRAAFLAGRDRYGWRSFTDFQLSTILERVEQLEAELNGGQPFAPVPPKAGPLGRPLD